jgi:DNA-binding response OmpR family regulator
MKLLIVDDNKKILQLFSEYFNLSGIEGIFVENGNNLGEIISVKNPDFIVLDMAMPEFDGFYSLEEIKKSNFDFSHVIILTAAELSETEKQKVHDYGVGNYLEKPIDLSILKEIFSQNDKSVVG